jgi:hypothetical protein
MMRGPGGFVNQAVSEENSLLLSSVIGSAKAWRKRLHLRQIKVP